MKNLLILLLLGFLAACSAPEGEVKVAADREGLTLLVDGAERGAIGKTPVVLLMPVGTHEIKVEGVSHDGQWRYEGTQTVTVTAGAKRLSMVVTQVLPSPQHTARLAQEAQARREAVQGWAELHADEIAAMEAQMVAIPGGNFVMGSDENEVGHTRYESPTHKVTLAPFAVGQFEVTFAQFDLFCGATGRALPFDEGWGRGSRPAINVSWDDVAAYAQWLSDITGHNYRLPSEAQWEFAARGGSETPYYWGEVVAAEQANHGADGPHQTLPVGGFPPNPFGLFDMAGNVAEWCGDSFHRGYKGAPSDGSVWEAGGAGRVIKGGSWFDFPQSLRPAARAAAGAAGRSNLIGFRVVRVGD